MDNKKLDFHGKGGMQHYIIPEVAESDKAFHPGIKTISEAKREVKVLCEAGDSSNMLIWIIAMVAALAAAGTAGFVICSRKKE